jgi:hypothetical protein
MNIERSLTLVNTFYQLRQYKPNNPRLKKTMPPIGAHINSSISIVPGY